MHENPRDENASSSRFLCCCSVWHSACARCSGPTIGSCTLTLLCMSRTSFSLLNQNRYGGSVGWTESKGLLGRRLSVIVF